MFVNSFYFIMISRSYESIYLGLAWSQEGTTAGYNCESLTYRKAAADLLKARIPRGREGRLGRCRDGLARRGGVIKETDESHVLDDTEIQVRAGGKAGSANEFYRLLLLDPGTSPNLSMPSKTASSRVPATSAIRRSMTISRR